MIVVMEYPLVRKQESAFRCSSLEICPDSLTPACVRSPVELGTGAKEEEEEKEDDILLKGISIISIGASRYSPYRLGHSSRPETTSDKHFNMRE